jgi:hypothetical protein
MAPPVAEAAITGATLVAGLMASRTPRDVKAAALDANSRSAKRARLLRQGLGIAILLSQCVLKRRRLFPLIPDLLNMLLFFAMLILLLGCFGAHYPFNGAPCGTRYCW